MRKLIALPFRLKILAIEATAFLLVARLIAWVPLSRWARYLGDVSVETPNADIPESVRELSQIRWAIRAVSSRAPWRSDCLPQAIAARIMLQRRGLPSTLYFGATITETDKGVGLIAHAWVRCGSTIVTGARGSQRFQVASTFAK